MADDKSSEGAIEQLKERIETLEKENRKWMRLAGMNRLTELPNNLMLYQVVLPRELRKGIQSPIALACTLICPDGLGEINQRHGRIVGDDLIKLIGDFLKEQLEGGEQLYHCDGSNFAILMLGSTEGGARRRAALIKDKFKEKTFSIGNRTFRGLTCSAGASEISGQIGPAEIPEMIEKLYHQLCNSLYKAKEHGGDTVMGSPKV